MERSGKGRVGVEGKEEEGKERGKREKEREEKEKERERRKGKMNGDEDGLFLKFIM